MLKSTDKTRKKRKRFTQDDLEITVIALPTILLVLVLNYLPLYGVIIPFKDLKLFGTSFIANLFKSEWIGFKNFGFLFSSPDTLIIIRNTLLYNITFIVLGMVLAVGLSIIFNEMINKTFAKVCQTMLFLPHFLSYVVISYFVYSFLSLEKGMFNGILTTLGKETINWYTEPKYWPFILVFTRLWKGLGYSMVVYLAAIKGIDKSLYEAAAIDGGNKWQQAIHITLPSLRTIITIMLIFALGGLFSADFGLFYNVPKESGALMNVTNVINTFVYRTFMSLGNVGMSSAAALLQSLVGCVMLLLGNYFANLIDRESAFF